MRWERGGLAHLSLCNFNTWYVGVEHFLLPSTTNHDDGSVEEELVEVAGEYCNGYEYAEDLNRMPMIEEVRLAQVPIEPTLMAGVGVLIPMMKLSQLVSEVIVIEGPASASISATRSLNGKVGSLKFCQAIVHEHR